jgi:hypothetical protein
MASPPVFPPIPPVFPAIAPTLVPFLLALLPPPQFRPPPLLTFPAIVPVSLAVHTWITAISVAPVARAGATERREYQDGE